MRSWDKFCLLMWKNWKLQIRKPISFIVEIGLPILVVSALLLLRYYIELNHVPEHLYNDLSLEYIDVYGQIAYSPNTKRVEQLIKDNIKPSEGKIIGKANAKELEEYLMSLNTTDDIGLQFDDKFPTDPNQITGNITIKIRYNSASYDGWKTEYLYPDFEIKYGSRNEGNDVGGPPSYHYKYFDALMYKLTNGLLKLKSSNLPTLSIRRFPYMAYDEDVLLENLGTGFLISFLFMTAFVYSCVSIVKAVTLEKEKQLKESMKVMGLPTWLHWTAWCVQIFIPFFLVIIFTTVILKFKMESGAVLAQANWSLLFIFLLLYIIDLIMFSFALSVFFTKANRAASISGIIWVLSMVPHIIIRTSGYRHTASSVKYATSLLPTCAMSYAFDIICLFETRFIGIQWDNLFETTQEINVSLGGTMLVMIFDIFLYLGIALYVEQIFPGEFGVPQKWYFLFTPTFWRANKSNAGYQTSSANHGEFFEEEPNSLKAGIRIMNLSKTFGANDAVKSMSLNLFEDQITVLLGHNGAGKTTTMSMLTGMFPPTKGTAVINGYDIRTQIMNVRDSMGLCPQHNVLFDDLTVKEHLIFFSKLKGCKGSEVQKEVNKFLNLLSLGDKANAKSSALSGGMKRKLCVGIALCGNSKVIMLDEPTAGMDPSARRFIWEFLQEQKKGRTILLTTHFMDEADLLGDRIAIMSGGVVKCCGSSFFLKKKYGTGYYLIIDQLPNCQPHNVTALLRQYIPDIEYESNAGSELTYLLPEKYAYKFPQMLLEMEDHTSRLGIRSFGISLTDLEEVFMKVGTNETGRKISRQDHAIINGYSQVTMSEPILETGIKLYLNQIQAVFTKKMLSTIRSWGMELAKIILPVLYTILILYASQSSMSVKSHSSRNFTLTDYDDTITLVEAPSDKCERPNDHEQYVKMLDAQGQKYELTNDITSRVLDLTRQDQALVKYQYIVGASFCNASGPVAWFSNEPFHTLPLSLQLLMNMYVQNENFEMNFVNYPLTEKKTALDDALDSTISSIQIVITLSLAIAYIGNFYILFNIRERMSRAKHLQFVSGINVFVFWFTAFVSDLLTFVLPCAAVIITFIIMQPPAMSSFSSLSTLVFLFFNFGLAVMPFMYIFAYLFSVPSTGYSRLFFLSFAAGFPAVIVMKLIKSADSSFYSMRWIFRIIPHYDFIESVNNMATLYPCDKQFDTCGGGISREECKALTCEGNTVSICCVSDGLYSASDTGIIVPMIYTYMIAIVTFIFIFLIDLKMFTYWKYRLFPNKLTPKPQSYIDPDVRNEDYNVHNTPLAQLQSQYVLVLKDLTKNYKKFTAVNGLNLTVKRSECFGLLGVNGAGKTTTFKMMTGDEMISSGDGWVNGFSIKSAMKKVHRYIGYCPQFDALLDNLTARETLKIFSLIRGVPRDECAYTAEKLAQDFDFTEHLDKEVKQLSGGNKRKLSTAIALIGDAPIIFLDEPTTGMDPATKRHLWNQLSKLRERGKSIILTSHSMEECEALCTRLVIMVNGNFQCLGSTQHLKNKFAEGFSVTLKIRKPQFSSGLIHSDTVSIENFMAEHFPQSELREKHQELLSYYIRDKSIKWSRLFSILERAKSELDIEDYSVGQASLEQVFLTFTKNQVSTDDSPKVKTRYCGMKCC